MGLQVVRHTTINFLYDPDRELTEPFINHLQGMNSGHGQTLGPPMSLMQRPPSSSDHHLSPGHLTPTGKNLFCVLPFLSMG